MQERKCGALKRDHGQSAASAREPINGSSRRSERQILKIGLLEQGSHASFCLVTSASSHEAEVKTFGALRDRVPVRLRIAEFAPMHADVISQSERTARLRFNDFSDLQSILAPRWVTGPQARRVVPRLAVCARAVLRAGGFIYPGILSNISTRGAKIRTSKPVVPAAAAYLMIPELPLVQVFVRWVEDCDVGVVFSAPLPLEILARWYATTRLERNRSTDA